MRLDFFDERMQNKMVYTAFFLIKPFFERKLKQLFSNCGSSVVHKSNFAQKQQNKFLPVQTSLTNFFFCQVACLAPSYGNSGISGEATSLHQRFSLSLANWWPTERRQRPGNECWLVRLQGYNLLPLLKLKPSSVSMKLNTL